MTTQAFQAEPATGTATLLHHVQVRNSPVHGLGVFALRPLPAGSVIGSYEGRRYSEAEAKSRRWNQSLTYVFGLSDGSLIDGSEGGNATQHINHSCAPNCAAYEVDGDDGVPVICIETLYEIEAGEELFLDYSLDAEAPEPSAFECCCGAAECRGSMLAPA
jgi:SET domain-containing protein